LKTTEKNTDLKEKNWKTPRKSEGSQAKRGARWRCI